jgi:vacuolar-type H+-ATPase catalytic subunit A/Vma1
MTPESILHDKHHFHILWISQMFWTRKTSAMIGLISKFYERMSRAIELGVPLQRILDMPVRQEIARCKIEPSEKFVDVAKAIERNLETEFGQLTVAAGSLEGGTA